MLAPATTGSGPLITPCNEFITAQKYHGSWGDLAAMAAANAGPVPPGSDLSGGDSRRKRRRTASSSSLAGPEPLPNNNNNRPAGGGDGGGDGGAAMAGASCPEEGGPVGVPRASNHGEGEGEGEGGRAAQNEDGRGAGQAGGDQLEFREGMDDRQRSDNDGNDVDVEVGSGSGSGSVGEDDEDANPSSPPLPFDQDERDYLSKQCATKSILDTHHSMVAALQQGSSLASAAAMATAQAGDGADDLDGPLNPDPMTSLQQKLTILSNVEKRANEQNEQYQFHSAQGALPSVSLGCGLGLGPGMGLGPSTLPGVTPALPLALGDVRGGRGGGGRGVGGGVEGSRGLGPGMGPQSVLSAAPVCLPLPAPVANQGRDCLIAIPTPLRSSSSGSGSGSNINNGDVNSNNGNGKTAFGPAMQAGGMDMLGHDGMRPGGVLLPTAPSQMLPSLLPPPPFIPQPASLFMPPDQQPRHPLQQGPLGLLGGSGPLELSGRAPSPLQSSPLPVPRRAKAKTKQGRPPKAAGARQRSLQERDDAAAGVKAKRKVRKFDSDTAAAPSFAAAVPGGGGPALAVAAGPAMAMGMGMGPGDDAHHLKLEAPGPSGVLQCLGSNRKKKTRCRNAALMEYVGPRPRFCAEHIAMDPEALYHKCNFLMPSFNAKKCKEIVYKEFKHCYKHFQEWLMEDFSGPNAIELTRAKLACASQLLSQLESEAAEAKSEDLELYQRKSKLVPKYQSMVKSLQDHLRSLRRAAPPAMDGL